MTQDPSDDERGGSVANFGSLGPQNLLFGFSAATVVERLTEDNWREKAVVRVGDPPLIHYYIQPAQRGKRRVYLVEAQPLEDFEMPCGEFADLADALAFINGKGNSPLGAMRLAQPDELPEDEGPEVIITGKPGL